MNNLMIGLMLFCLVSNGLFSSHPVRAEASSTRVESEPYVLETFNIPESLKLEVSGLSLIPDGRLAIAIRKGEIWIADQVQDPELTQFSRFASGLHEPLGLAFRDGAFYTVQRTELTRIRDLDEDGIADEYWTIAKGWGVTGNYHEYAYGPQFDLDGNAWITLNIGIGKGVVPDDNAWRGWSLKVSPNGSWVPVSGGFRSPSGIGMNPLGDIFATDQQGNWFPTCPLIHVRKGVFHGHAEALSHNQRPMSSIKWKGKIPKGISVVDAARLIPPFELPAVWFPYRKMGMSATDVLWNTHQGNFGPFDGQAFVGEFTMSMVLRVQLEKINGVYQGACFRFFEGLQCGVLRLAWGKDGSLIIGQSNRGWNSLGNRSYGMQKLSWTGVRPFEMQKINALPDGFRITFTKPISEKISIGKDRIRIRSFTYHYHPNYGSEEIEVAQLKISNHSLSTDHRVLDLRVEGLREGFVHEIECIDFISRDGVTLKNSLAAYTLNKIPEVDRKK